jgi:acetyl-CoA carboxylase biotin carboxyl carrier protein
MSKSHPKASKMEGRALDLEQIKLIIEMMQTSELTEFEIEEEGFKLRICRGKEEHTTLVTAGSAPPFTPVLVPSTSPEAGSEDPEADDPRVEIIKSPMVGTFYRAPSPENPSFVEKGTEVEEDTIVCIIEAMKVMNEIQAETTGEIIEILVENGQSLEYGQPLFKVRKGA